ERWLISYADFITLLLAVFAFMYSSANMKARAREEAFRSVARHLGFNEAVVHISEGEMRNSIESELDNLNRIKNELQAKLERYRGSGVTVTLDSRGLVISLAAARFFPSGQASINPSQVPVLDAVAEAIANVQNPIRIEGHTDSVPISNEHFKDNWDLSTARAAEVLRYVSEKTALDPAQLSAAGYGPYHPIGDNLSDEGRALNRRVDIVIPPVFRELNRQVALDIYHRTSQSQPLDPVTASGQEAPER